MGLEIITLVKQVPDTQHIADAVMKPDGTIDRAALPSITNPEDLNALEEALKIKAMLGGTIAAITLGPPSAINALKDCLYRGIDDAILVTDQKFVASDTLATSYALTCAIKKIGTFDLIFCGRQAIDGDTAQIGAQIAEKLKINQLTYVTEIMSIIDDKSITVRRATDYGYEVIKSKLPVLLTIVAEANEPRFPSAKLVMRYKNICCKCETSYDEAYMYSENSNCKYIKQWNAKDVKAKPERCGLIGSQTKVKKIENVVLTANAIKKIANTESAIGDLMRELSAEHIIC